MIEMTLTQHTDLVKRLLDTPERWAGRADELEALHKEAAAAITALQRGEVLGYLNLYRRAEGEIEAGSTDLYETADVARSFNASEFDDNYLGVASVVLLAEKRGEI